MRLFKALCPLLACGLLLSCESDPVPDPANGPAVASTAQPLLNETVVLDAVADTTLKDWDEVGNFGDEHTLLVTGSSFSDIDVALVRFDQAAILAAVGSDTLVSAHLELTIATPIWDWSDSELRVHRMQHDWSESAATWLCSMDTDFSIFGRFFNNCNAGDDWGIEPWSYYPVPFDETPTDSVQLSFGQSGVRPGDPPPGGAGESG